MKLHELILLSGLAGLLFSCSPHYHEGVVSGLSAPESVLPVGEFLYVSNVGSEGKPGNKDGNGFISKIYPTGQLAEERFLPKEGTLHGPKGMATISGILYVADIDRVVGFDLETRDMVFEVVIEGATFLNDIAARGETLLYVSDTETGKIHTIDLISREVATLPIPELSRANGLALSKDQTKLYCTTFDSKADSRLVEINLSDNTLRDIGRQAGYLDGLAITKNGFLVSDWVASGDDPSGKIWQVNPETGEFVTVELPEFYVGPADFYLSRNGKFIFLPSMKQDRLYIRKLPR